jgi:enoyl-CoA hydratase/carnithine racemase
MTTESEVLSSQRGGVLTLTLNRPGRMNAWTDGMETRYFNALAEANHDPEVRAIVVTGAGRAFCAGADMDVLDELSAEGVEYQALSRPKTFPLTVRKPLIAAINGACAGIGLVQALYCDIRIVSAEAKLTTAFARRGLIAEHGISWILPRVVGLPRALDLLISGRIVRGDEAAELGLANWAVEPDQVLARAESYAAEIATYCSPRAAATIKQQLYAHQSVDLEHASTASDTLLAESLTWPDLAEGVASFVDRREPRFPPLS